MQARIFAEKYLNGDFEIAITAAFSIREAAYKALNPVYGQGINYETIAVDFATSTNDLLLLQSQNTKIPSSLICRFTAVKNQVLTAAVLQKGVRTLFSADCGSSAEFGAVV
jgi:4'-phosphopantetheinyl transferase EntD